MSDKFRGPTPEARDYSNAITAAIEEVSVAHIKAGKRTMFMDPMSALLGVLGSFIAGAPPEIRSDVQRQVHKLIDVAIDQALSNDTGQNVVSTGMMRQ